MHVTFYDKAHQFNDSFFFLVQEGTLIRSRDGAIIGMADNLVWCCKHASGPDISYWSQCVTVLITCNFEAT